MRDTENNLSLFTLLQEKHLLRLDFWERKESANSLKFTHCTSSIVFLFASVITLQVYKLLNLFYSGKYCNVIPGYGSEYSSNGYSIFINGHETNKLVRDPSISSFPRINNPVSISVPVSGGGLSSFVRPVSVIIQTVPVIIAIPWATKLTCEIKKVMKTKYHDRIFFNLKSVSRVNAVYRIMRATAHATLSRPGFH